MTQREMVLRVLRNSRYALPVAEIERRITVYKSFLGMAHPARPAIRRILGELKDRGLVDYNSSPAPYPTYWYFDEAA